MTEYLEKIKQAGLFTKGMVYFLLGGLTTLAALGKGGQTSGKDEVSSFILDQPFGKVLLGITALGLIAYSFWRFYQTYKAGQDHYDDKKKKVFHIIRYLYSGLLYLLIAIGFLSRAIPGSAGGSGEGKKQMIGKVLSFPGGETLVYIFALILLIQAIFQFRRGIKGGYMKKLDDHSADAREYKLIRYSGKIGYIARGIVFLVIAYFLYRVAQAHSANEFQGTKGALEFISGLPMGQILLLITSVGLLCYGVFNFMLARHSDLSRADG